MSQFMLVEREMDTRGLSAVLLSPIDADDDLLRKVGVDYFGDWRGCRSVTDVAGSAESLVDDVCDAQLDGDPIEETTFVRLLRLLVESGVRFVIWHGSDYSNLPAAHTWSRVVEMVRSQAQIQPADLYLYFVPPVSGISKTPET